MSATLRIFCRLCRRRHNTHLLRNTFRYASRRDWDELARDLKPVYTAPNAEMAGARFDEFADKWRSRYPAIVNLWRAAWEEFIVFLDNDVEIRKIICSTNAIESLNARYRRAVPRPRALPDRPGRAEMPLPGDPVTRPDRARPGPLDNALEVSVECLRDHLRGAPHPKHHQLTDHGQLHR